MAIFCRKKLEPPARICVRLKKLREENVLSLENLAEQTHVSAKYLQAIEEGRFEDLPKAKAHRLAYLRSYAEAVGYSPEAAQKQFFSEAGLSDIKAAHPATHMRAALPSFSFIFRNAALTLFVLAFLGYLVYQVRGIIQPPRLAIFTPVEGFVYDNLSALVQGETEKECRLTINGLEARVNEEGKFEVAVDLTAGVNTITVSVTKKHGKTTTEVRHVVVKPDNKNSLTLNK